MGPMAHDSTLLEREMYSEAEEARLLRVPQGTLHVRGRYQHRGDLGRDQAGYERTEIADELGISLNDVAWALAHESITAAA